ncbi:AAA family ATPase [Francisella philomiragia]|uniref:AAA family ATPase n=1 Tax=Francisella philomiragia TaxID=28110 RepID=UPI001907228F|nr:AAA family ATPase [Francisella philomiragia]MBK2025593.1 AAA family ATPase [Francisella philomiragia]
MLEAYRKLNLKIPFDKEYYYETNKHKEIFEDLKVLIDCGGIFAITGMVGSGKTTLINRIQNHLESENKIVVSRSVSTDKKKVNITVLFTALFYDLSSDERSIKVPQGEKRERELISLIKKRNKPVAFFIDEAHDIHGQTLIALKRVSETVRQAGCKLSIILAGHPKLENSLSSSTMEEIGARVKIFSINNAITDKVSFINGWLKKYVIKPTKTTDVITQEAVEYLADSLQTPLQIEDYLNKSVQYAYSVGEQQISKEMVESVLSPDLKSIEAQLRRNGYQPQQVCDLLKATHKEVQDFLSNKPNHPRRKEFLKKLAYINITK